MSDLHTHLTQSYCHHFSGYVLSSSTLTFCLFSSEGTNPYGLFVASNNICEVLYSLCTENRLDDDDENTNVFGQEKLEFHLNLNVLNFGVYRHFQQYFSYIMATSFSGGGSRSTQREPPTLEKQLVNFITCGCESTAPF